VSLVNEKNSSDRARAARSNPLLYNGTTGETRKNGQHHGAPRSIARDFYITGERYMAVVWIGPNASTQQREAAGRIVASLRFSRPHNHGSNGFSAKATIS
jgi:hypothetical protein